MDTNTPQNLIKVTDNILLGNKSINLRDPSVQRQLEQKAQQSVTQTVYKPPKMPEFVVRNQNEKAEQLLEESNQTGHSIHYETKKTNAQLTTLLKVIDSQTDELERLRSVNQELQKINKGLEEDRKHATRNTVIITIITGILLLGIEHCKDIYNFILSLIK